jgi:diguanylate cyclase (GGDEF)-like protein
MNNLQSKIFVFFMAMLVVVMTVILLIVYRTTYAHTQTQIAEQLDAGNAVVQNELESRKRYVGSTSRTITKDFNLIEQVVSRDANSITAAIESYRGRAGATFSVVTDINGNIIATTLHDMEVGQALPFGNFSEAEITKAQNVYGLYKDHAYQVFIWPLYAPEPNQIACLVMGYMLDDELTKRLQKLTGLDISFIQPGKVFASSLPDTERALLRKANISFASPNAWRTVTLDNIDYVTFIAPLPMSNGQTIMVLLQRSLTDALRDYKSLQLQLIATQVLSLILAAIGAFFIASSITRPLRRMTEYVKKIAAGKYSAQVPLDSKGEIGILVQEFTHMQHEITEREASILHLAYHDALTNLPNRNDFQRRVQAQVDAAKHINGRAAVFVMDLDNFSDINVTLGHLSGDFLLRKVAERLLNECCEGDHIARLGGDEFAILIAGFINVHDVIQRVMHYRKIFNDAFEVENISLTVNATFGVAIYPEHAENAGTLMQRAEVAMYVGKRKKMPYSIYNSNQDHHSIVRLALMSELKPAIELNELVLYYQPKLELATNTINAVECLVRWIHPIHGFISPNDFIPLAEQTGNIRLLTRWVINAAFAQNRKWRDELQLDLSMSINISAVDLLDPHFLSYVETQLQTHNLPAQCIVLEVTESAVMDDPEKAIAILSQLNDMGVGLSIDDFGTGYSSMAQLKRLPVHELKIDKSFVLDVVSSEDDKIIVRSTIELAHNMHLKVVAEGVESLAVLNLLQDLHCDSVQGFYLSKPVAAQTFETWLTSTYYLIARLDYS